MQDTTLSAAALKNAETYFVQTYGGDKPKASEGYGYTFIITSTKGGETLKSGLEVSAVNFEGQGWKILPFSYVVAIFIVLSFPLFFVNICF